MRPYLNHISALTQLMDEQKAKSRREKEYDGEDIWGNDEAMTDAEPEISPSILHGEQTAGVIGKRMASNLESTANDDDEDNTSSGLRLCKHTKSRFSVAPGPEGSTESD